MLENTSDTGSAAQIPSMPKNRGSTSTHTISNINVLIKEMAADTLPLFNAVKKEDANILKPHRIKFKEYT